MSVLKAPQNRKPGTYEAALFADSLGTFVSTLMKLHELKTHLANNPDWNLRFILPDGNQVPAHAHVTEVARIDKKYIDCGGTFRTDSFCRLQTWVADDLQHRLSGQKLLGILNKASTFLETEDLEVDVEHESGVISQYPLQSIKLGLDALLLHLTARHTACLAEDKCLRPPQPAAASLFKPIPTFTLTPQNK
ncbi:MAG: hypothetical protein JWM16_5265 [Verrucomicrobiales bacterium]|nr:hypothetical protein [Verrucomicrobiales bacterium]